VLCKNTDKLVLLLVLTFLPGQPVPSHSAPIPKVMPLSVEDALNTAEVAQLLPIELSSDGEWLAYTVKTNRRSVSITFETWARTGVHDVFTGTDVRVLKIATGESRTLTGGKYNNYFPVWSPDGHYLAFLSDRDGSGQLKPWIWDTMRNQMRKLSDLSVRQFGQIEWMPDGRRLVIPVLPARLSLEDYVKRVTYASGSRNVSLSNVVLGSTAILYQSSESGFKLREGAAADAWNLDTMTRDLVSIDVANGSVRMLVRGQRIANFLVSPDGSRIAYTISKRFEKPGSQQILYDLLTTEFSSSREQVVASDIRLGYDGAQFSWSPDGRHLAYRSYGPAEDARDCFVSDLAGGSPRKLTTLLPGQRGPSSGIPVWDRKSENIYLVNNGALWRASLDNSTVVEVAQIPNRQIVQITTERRAVLWTPDNGQSTVVVTRDPENKRDGFFKVDLASGKNRQLLEKLQCYTCANLSNGQSATVTPDGKRLVYIAEDAQHASDLWTADAAFEHSTQLTHLNPQFDKYEMGSTRLIHWLSDDGESLAGALLLPSDYREGKRYPLIVWVYGGSSLADRSNRFGFQGSGPFNMQLFATRGYAVFFPNAPQNLGTPMVDLAKTVLPGINKLIELGIADSEHVGVMGHSYGGYSVLSLIVQTKRFKAAIVADGYGDLVGSYGIMDKAGAAFGIQSLEQGQGLMGGPPWQLRDRFIENSPIFYLERIETPLLLIHGSDDTTVPPFLGDEVFVSLRRLGRKVEYAKYEKEGHSQLYWSYPNQTDLLLRMIAWFGSYLEPAR
jgi:dipeptidyl aminopeptidase/acylaminoacyl peptidase